MYRWLTRYLATTALLTAVFCAPLHAMAQGAAADMAAVKAIDTDCLAIQNATMALHPVHLALVQSKWNVLSDADYAVAQQTTTSVAFADVWKTNTGYAWVHAHSFDAKGNQRATQLSFRQKDGTLERARQAATVPDLDAAAAKAAYYASDGTLIFSVTEFDANDPMLTKRIQSLPFYSQLPK